MKLSVNLILAILVVLSATALSYAYEDSISKARPYQGQTVWNLPEISEEEIDIGLWALIISKEYDSSVNIDHYLDILDSMASEIDRMIAGRNADIAKFLMTRMFMFEPGAWNDNRPFTYDLDDPMGDKAANKMLNTYLDTRKGNCVTMPTLFLALMQRVDPDVPFQGAAAPLHLFCRFYDRQECTVWNVEATNGGNPARNQWYIESLGISQTAMDSATYLRNLSKKEYLARLMEVLVSLQRQERNYSKALKFIDLILALDSRSVNALVQKGSIFALMGQGLHEKIALENGFPTPDEHRQLKLYEAESEKYIRRARSLGWKPESQDSRTNYLRTIESARKETN